MKRKNNSPPVPERKELERQLETLARSSYFYHRARMRMTDKYLTIRQNITEIFEANRRCYGYDRL